MIRYSIEPRYQPTSGLGWFDLGSHPIPTSGSRYPVPSSLDEFSQYEAYNVSDWDGYGAESISSETIQTARRFKNLWRRQVPMADIAPGADGTIGFEWRSGLPTDRTVTFIEVGPGNTVKALRVHAGTKPPERWEPCSVMIGNLSFLDILFPPDEAV